MMDSFQWAQEEGRKGAGAVEQEGKGGAGVVVEEIKAGAGDQKLSCSAIFVCELNLYSYLLALIYFLFFLGGGRFVKSGLASASLH